MKTIYTIICLLYMVSCINAGEVWVVTARPVWVVTQKPTKVSKVCSCSKECSCGCNQGKECGCNKGTLSYVRTIEPYTSQPCVTGY